MIRGEGGGREVRTTTPNQCQYCKKQHRWVYKYKMRLVAHIWLFMVIFTKYPFSLPFTRLGSLDKCYQLAELRAVKRHQSQTHHFDFGISESNVCVYTIFLDQFARHYWHSLSIVCLCHVWIWYDWIHLSSQQGKVVEQILACHTRCQCAVFRGSKCGTRNICLYYDPGMFKLAYIHTFVSFFIFLNEPAWNVECHVFNLVLSFWVIFQLLTILSLIFFKVEHSLLLYLPLLKNNRRDSWKKIEGSIFEDFLFSCVWRNFSGSYFPPRISVLFTLHCSCCGMFLVCNSVKLPVCHLWPLHMYTTCTVFNTQLGNRSHWLELIGESNQARQLMQSHNFPIVYHGM